MALWTPNLTDDTKHYLSGQHPPMGEQLIATGLATSVQVERALQEQRQTGQRLGEILIAHGILYEADLARTLAAMFQLPYRDLSLELPDPAALRQIPEAFCRSRNVLPVAIEANAVVVALADPRDIQTRDDLRMMASMPVRPVVVAPDQLRRAQRPPDEPASKPSSGGRHGSGCHVGRRVRPPPRSLRLPPGAHFGSGRMLRGSGATPPDREAPD